MTLATGMNESNVLLVLVIVGGAFLLAIPGAIAFVRSLSKGNVEVDLFQRVRALEAEVEALRRELGLVRAERERLQTDLAAAKARIGELEALMAAYQAFPPGSVSGAATRRSRSRSAAEVAEVEAAERVSMLTKERVELQRQLSVVEAQITAAGGEKRAAAELVVHRDDLRSRMVGVERELDEGGGRVRP